jgi:hypothetical protein
MCGRWRGATWTFADTGPTTARGKFVSRNNALRHGSARPVASDPVAAKAIDILNGNFSRFAERSLVSRACARWRESFFDHVRIRTVRLQIFYDLDEFEMASSGKHASAANQLERTWRYEQSVLAKRRKAMRAFRDAGASV